MLVPGWIWQTMHWLDGIERVNSCFDGMSGFVLGDGRINSRTLSKVAVDRVVSRMFDERIIGIDYVARAASAGPGSLPADHLFLGTRAADPATRVFCKPRKVGSVRSKVPKPRSPSFTSGLPGSSARFWDSYLRFPFRHHARRRVRRCRAEKLPNAGSAQETEHALGASFLPRWAAGKFAVSAVCRRTP